MPYIRVLVNNHDLLPSFCCWNSPPQLLSLRFGIFADIKRSRNTVPMEGQEMCSQLHCRIYDSLLTGNTDLLLSTPVKLIASNTIVLLDLVRHLSIQYHYEGCSSVPAILRGDYVTRSHMCKQCPHHLLGEDWYLRSSRGPGLECGPNSVMDWK